MAWKAPRLDVCLPWHYLTYLLINIGVKILDNLSTTFAALADPTRRAILARLAQGEASVNQLAEPFRISLPAISRHLKVLERADLIERRQEAQFRICRLNPIPMQSAISWLEEHARFWSQQLDALTAFVESDAPANRKGRDDD